MIVVLIIGILIATAVPNMVTARTRSSLKSCQRNMRSIDAAKMQWAVELNMPESASPTMADVLPYLQSTPECYFSGTYDLGTVGTITRCSLAEHPPI